MIIDGKEVGDFTYKEKIIDQRGHIRYVTNCYLCEKEITYGCIKYKKPICYECSYKVGYENRKKRKRAKAEYDNSILQRMRTVLDDKARGRCCLDMCMDNQLCQKYGMKCTDAIMKWITEKGE